MLSQQIKEKMDAKFGGPFHCICGQAFGFRVTHEVSALLLLCLSVYVQRSFCPVVGVMMIADNPGDTTRFGLFPLKPVARP